MIQSTQHMKTDEKLVLMKEVWYSVMWSQSLNLNPIENVWHELKHKIKDYHSANLKELRKIIWGECISTCYISVEKRKTNYSTAFETE